MEETAEAEWSAEVGSIRVVESASGQGVILAGRLATVTVAAAATTMVRTRVLSGVGEMQAVVEEEVRMLFLLERLVSLLGRSGSLY